MTALTREEIDNLYPITERLKYFAHVIGHVQATRSDISWRQDELLKHLLVDGWTVYNQGTQIDPSLFLQVHTIDLRMHKRGAEYGLGEEIRAQAAVIAATTKMFFGYSPVVAAAGELAPVVLDTLRGIKMPSIPVIRHELEIPWWLGPIAAAFTAAFALSYASDRGAKPSVRKIKA